jgi:RHS repeat-associated protein
MDGNTFTLTVDAIDSPLLAAVPSDVSFAFAVTIFDVNAKPTLVYNVADPERIQLSSAVPGAVEYDLEWVFVDVKDPILAESPFSRKDPVRISGTELSFQVDRHYPRGQLHCRARAVAQHPLFAAGESTGRLPGAWSDMVTINLTGPTAAGFFEPNKNWTYQISYLEGPRFKRLMSFYDGSLRNRQSQTRLDSEGIRLAGETKYDFEGRPTLKFLPTPVPGQNLDYIPRLNLALGPNNTSVEFTPALFNQGSTTAASTQSGASKYYSISNDVPGPMQDYIPDAEGFPYSTIEYVRDGTDRLRRSSGIGKQLSLAGGHDTVFRYGSANATQLRRLFGSNVGPALQYSRDVVSDPNRQSMVSYVDNLDRVIATALVGAAPANLVSIAPLAASVTVDLAENNILDRSSGTSQSVSTIVNEASSNYHFKYDLTAVDDKVASGDPQVPHLCASGKYDLTVRIIDPHGHAVPLNIGSTPQNDPECSCASPECTQTVNELKQTLGNPKPEACSLAPVGSRAFAVPTLRFCAKLTEPGEYEVTKILRLSEGELEHRIEETKQLAGIANSSTWVNSWTASHAPDPAYCAGNCQEFCQKATVGDPNPLKAEECIRRCQSPQDWVIPRASGQECEGLLASINADVKPGGWAHDNYGAKTAQDHPEFCHVAICKDTGSSRIYDALTVASGPWTDALCKGFLNPLGMTPDAGGPPAEPLGCSPTRDPYFALGALGAGHGLGGVMEQYLRNYTDTLTDWPGARLSLWEFVAMPEVHPGLAAPVPPDNQWRLFRSIYQGLKQRIHLEIVENDRHCSYLNDPHANVKRPYAFSTVDQVFSAMDDTEAQYRQLVCDARVDNWRARLQDTCKLSRGATAGQVQQLLGQYCLRTFGISNPLAVLSKEALKTDDQLLKQIQSQLGSCDLGNLAMDDPYDHQRVCRPVCCTNEVPSSCARDVLRSLSAAADRTVDLTRLYGSLSRGSCVPWADELISDKEGFELRARGGHRGCRLILLTQGARLIAPARITNPGVIVVVPTSAAPATITAGLTFTGFALEAVVDGNPARLFLFSDCDFPTAEKGKSTCSSQLPSMCLAALTEKGEDAKKSAATHLLTSSWANVCTQSLMPGAHDVMWLPPPAVPDPPGPLTIGTQATATVSLPYKTADPKRDTLRCRTCLRELLTAAMQRSSDRAEMHNAIGPTRCFERILLRDESLVSLQVHPSRRECRTLFLTATAAQVSPSSLTRILELLTPVRLPVEFPALESGLSFTGFALKVRLQSEREIVVYVFSSCELRLDNDCPPGPACGTGLRADECLQGGMRLFGWRVRQAQQPLVALSPIKQFPWDKCFDQLDIDSRSVRLHRRGQSTDGYCSLAFLDANGGLIAPERVLEVLGKPYIASTIPSALPASLGDLGSFTGFAVKIKVAVIPPATVEAWIYSDCGFQTAEDCDDLVTGTSIPPFPPPADPVQACQKAVDAETHQRATLAWEAETRHIETEVRDVFFNKCLDNPFGERFLYDTSLPEYHYTLYYYDQAGNLVQTVPPAGVELLTQAQVDNYEIPGAPTVNPTHQAMTRYRYNSLNQPIRQSGPNDGTKRFWYNDAAQLRFLQSAAQAAHGEHTYVKYDARSRVIETGVVKGFTEKQIQSGWNDRDFPSQKTFKLTELTRTVYDSADSVATCAVLRPTNLRGRVAAAMADAGQGRPPTTTCYSYDPHGNVQMLAQLLPGLDLKRIDYEYDLLSGKILATHYQSGQPDALHHRFTYDGDNRIISAETSQDDQSWEKDAVYTYYKHGPVARLELGKNRVQGLDYTYTLQGWPKGINAGSGKLSADPGHDGSAGPNAAVGADAFGMTLDYFLGDYTPIGLTRGTFAPDSSPDPVAATDGNDGFSVSDFARDACGEVVSPEGCGLYDGNIVHAVTALHPFMANGESPLGFAYRYDQLYRLRSARSHVDLNLSTNTWPATSAGLGAWWTTVDYDGNDNIRKLQRFAKRTSGNDPPNSPSAWMMDDLTYHYEDDAQGRPLKDRLLHINDTVPADRYPDDLDDQGPFLATKPSTHNYAYDQDGRLIRDQAEGLSSIVWNHNSQVTSIHRENGSDLEFIYDAQGRRVAKVLKPGANEDTWEYEYDVRDDRSGTLATYRRIASAIKLKNETLNGAQRLGVFIPTGNASAAYKQYELTSYTNTVAMTVSDRILQGTPPSAEILTASDYYPFGSSLPGRDQKSRDYRYGFDGYQRDDELKGSGNSYYTAARLYDPRVSRWLSVDPVSVAKAHAATGSYSFTANNPLKYTDREGRSPLCCESNSVAPEDLEAVRQSFDEQWNEEMANWQQKLNNFNRELNLEKAQRNAEAVCKGDANCVSDITDWARPSRTRPIPADMRDTVFEHIAVNAVSSGEMALQMSMLQLQFASEAFGVAVSGLRLGVAAEEGGIRLSQRGLDLVGNVRLGVAAEEGGIRLSQRGLDLVEKHLARFGEDGPNSDMLRRLQDAFAAGRKVAGADAHFYLHEASEATMMGRGLSYEAAHAAALQRYGVSEFNLYAPEVIRAYPDLFSNAWRAAVGLPIR